MIALLALLVALDPVLAPTAMHALVATPPGSGIATGSPTAAASATPTAAPTAAAPVMPAPVTPGTVPASAPGVSATPTESPYHYRFVPRIRANRSAATPQIYAVYLNEKQLRSLGPIRIKVETTPNVVKVTSRSNGRDGNVPLVSPGDFEASSMLPKIPFIAAGMTVDLEFIATTAEGRTSVVRVPVRLN
ncbi:MAG: hypothetical protein NVS1B2_25280 [Vulcanimicrobiaceae bacterium]